MRGAGYFRCGVYAVLSRYIVRHETIYIICEGHIVAIYREVLGLRMCPIVQRKEIKMICGLAGAILRSDAWS